MEDIVFLDSDDEQDTKANVDTNKNISDVAPTTNSEKRAGGDDDVVVEYNHNDYADLVGPLKTANGTGPSVKPSQPPNNPVTTNVARKLPKRPGSMPPFALFSQEMRAKLQKEDPDIGFGDLGRKLGEMWHALKEEEKEEYRKKAKQVADARMKSYNDAMNAMSPNKRQMMENHQRMQMNKIKKKRTSGYSIFCSEYRRKLAQEQPDLTMADVSKTVADDWRLLSQDKKQQYEIRAQRFNTEEDKKWRQRMMVQQQNQMKMRQQMTGGRGGMGRGVPVSGRGGSVYRNILPKTSRGRGGIVYANPSRRGQYSGGAGGGQMNQSGLVISSVSSLSSTSSQSNYNLPRGISISKAAAEPDINLPKSISISRVEPEIQIVEENISLRQQQQSQQRVGSTMVTRGRGMSMRGRGQVVRPNISPRGMGMMTSRGRMITPATRGRPTNMMMSRGGYVSRGRGIPISSPVKRLVPGGSAMPMSPAKRMGSPIVNPMNAKRMRMPSTQQNNFNVPGAVNPASLDLVGRLCRVCGVSSPVIFRLSDRRDLVTKIHQVLNLDIDLEADVQSGYPGVICRKCSNLVETFHNFQLTAGEGQKTLVKQVEAAKARKEAAASAASSVETYQEILINTNSPESIGVDPLDSIITDDSNNVPSDDSNSILPDSELENITIKQEKICSNNSSDKKQSSSTSGTKTAPMTAVFAEAVTEMTTIKVEPDIVSIKREAEENDEESTKNEGEMDKSKKEKNVGGLESIEITPMMNPDDGNDENENDNDKANTEDESKKVKSNGDHNNKKNGQENESPVKSVSEALDDFSNTLDDAQKKLDDQKSSEKGEKSKSSESEAVADSPELGESTSKGSEDVNDDFGGLFSDYPDQESPSKDTDDVNENDDFGGLFSDYPDSGMNNGNEENTDDPDWDPMEGDMEDLEDAPGMEIRSLADKNGDNYYNSIPEAASDPLFEMEDGEGDDLGKINENGDEEFGDFEMEDPPAFEDIMMEEETVNNTGEAGNNEVSENENNEEMAGDPSSDQLLEDNPAGVNISYESGLDESQHDVPTDGDHDNVENPESRDEDEAENLDEVIEDNLNEDCELEQDAPIERSDESENVKDVQPPDLD